MIVFTQFASSSASLVAQPGRWVLARLIIFAFNIYFFIYFGLKTSNMAGSIKILNSDKCVVS